MTTSFLDHISQQIGTCITSYSALSGGDISEVYKLTTSSQELLLKTHSGTKAFPMLQAEKQGLEAIAKTNTKCSLVDT